MFEVYVLMPRKRKLILNFFTVFFFAAAALTFLAAVLFVVPTVLPAAIFALALGIYLNKRNVEYEYSYFDGEVRFAKIFNKSRRKTLQGYNMDTVAILAPEGDRSVYNYEHNPQVRILNLTSGFKNRKVYSMAVNTEKGLVVVKFEPDEKYLDAVCTKYPQKVIR